MKNKAFTLVELLGVIVILGILGVVIIPKVGDSITNSKETALITQEQQIKKAAHDFLIDNIELLETTDTITIKLGVLKQKGYLPINIKNPKTRKTISNESLITITKNGNNYDIQVSIIDLENVTENMDDNSPIIVLNGNYIEYVEVNSTYEEKGAIAQTSTGKNINNISIQIKQNDIEKTSIDTSQLLTYNVIYSATDSNGKITTATRTVIVKDSTAPTITFPTETNLHLSELADFNIMDGVSITDNYSTNPEITTNSSLAAIPGNYVITYTAKDSSRNETTERRVINVNDDFNKYYTNLEYIESTGTQYIDTGYYWQHENIEIDFDGVVTSNSSAQSLFGNEEYTTSSKTTRNFSGIPNGTNGSYGIYIGNTNQGTVSTTVGTRFNLKIQTATNKNLKVYKDNTLVIDKTYDGSVMAKQNSYDSSVNTIGNIFLFANHNTSRSETPEAGIQNIGGMKLYSFKMYDNNVLVRNFVPSIRNSDGVVGLYDLVKNKFYTNMGTGKFEYKMQNENPYERLYTKLEYIESTGKQYIDTKYKPNQNTSIEMDYDATASAKWLFGSRTATSNTDSFGVFLNYDTQYWIRIGGNTDNSAHKLDVNSTIGRHKIYATSSSFIQDNISSINYTTDNTQGTYSIYLGTINNSAGTPDNRMFSGKIYGFKIWENNTLVRNFVPAVRNSDNKPGLYDEVNDVFYTNSGTSEFTLGNPIN